MTSPYRTVLRTPGARSFVVAGFVGRMPMSMMTIAILLVVRHRTHSYGLAGAASAAGTLTQALATPFLGRLIDRRGQSAVLPKLLTVYLAGVVLLVVSAGTHAPIPLLFAGAIVAGAGQVPYPSLVRTRWSYLLGIGNAQLSTALALESVADEAVFTIGPVLVTGLSAVNVLLAPVVAGVLALLGTVPFIRASASEPPVLAVGSGTSAWRVPALWVLIVPGLLIGVVFGTIDVSMIAFAQHQGHAGLAGVLIGLVAFGSLLGGLWYGARQWRRDLAVRYQLSLATLALGSLPVLAAATVWQMTPAALIVGLSVAPTLIASSGLVARVVPSTARTEGFTWQSTGINVGAAAGAALAGLLIDSFGVTAGYLAAPIAALAGALVAFSGARLLGPRPVTQQPLATTASAASRD